MKIATISPYAFAGLNSATQQKFKSRKFTPSMVIKYVAIYLGVTREDIIGDSRKDNIVSARHLAMYIISTELEYNLQKTAEACGKSDHTSVIHALKTVRARIELDSQYAKKANQIIALLKKHNGSKQLNQA